jgi:fermentation-respiration switch protein FrsA (DUF1100 family)
MYVALVSILTALVVLAVLVRWVEPRLAFFPVRGEFETPEDFDVRYENVTIATADGERLRGWVMPVAKPRAHIVYFHGNGGNLSNWSPILAGLVRRGYAVFAFDYRGYGLSTGRPTERGVYRDVDAVVRQAWADGARTVPLIYWGRSLGAAMAGYAATVRPPDGLILEAGFPDARAAIRGSAPLRLLSLLASYRFPTATFVNRAQRPVLIMHGDRDSVIPIAIGRELFEKVQTPKRFAVIAGGDHNDGTPRDAPAYWTTVEGFVASLGHSQPGR